MYTHKMYSKIGHKRSFILIIFVYCDRYILFLYFFMHLKKKKIIGYIKKKIIISVTVDENNWNMRFFISFFSRKDKRFDWIYPMIRLEKIQQRSDVQLSGRTASLGIMGDQSRILWNLPYITALWYGGVWGVPLIVPPLCQETLVFWTANVSFWCFWAPYYLTISIGKCD